MTTVEADNRKPGASPCVNTRCFDSALLFAGRKTLTIRHDGEDYRLSITASGKLILTK